MIEVIIIIIIIIMLMLKYHNIISNVVKYR